MDVKKFSTALLLLLPSLATAEIPSSIKTMNKAVDSACVKDSNYETCRKVVLLAANFAMTNAGFYTENCLTNVKNEDKRTCADAKELIDFLEAENN